ncbi:cardiac phospholamban isoform X2 [Sander lucioperca]|uniref:cardiac phospholamban isoform X2 n=1 Tax=Sander lucioperca TaxID=283035 RepID=UPI00125E7B8B|nr:cardiac phospholamban isoform X2 [Sander lucioperca]
MMFDWRPNCKLAVESKHGDPSITLRMLNSIKGSAKNLGERCISDISLSNSNQLCSHPKAERRQKREEVTVLSCVTGTEPLQATLLKKTPRPELISSYQQRFDSPDFTSFKPARTSSVQLRSVQTGPAA